MFVRIAAIAALFSLPLPVAADSCSTGPVQCCNSLESSDSPAGAAVLGILSAILQNTAAKIGFGCSPMFAVGVGSGSACSSYTVCCENNNVGGAISIGCLPVAL